MEEELITGRVPEQDRTKKDEESRVPSRMKKSGENPGCVGERSREEMPDLAEVIASGMNLPEKDWSQYPPLSLAWIGDTVYDLIVRSILLRRGMTQTDRLHRKAAGIVNARAQAEAMVRIRERLTEEEQVIYRRGHNAKPAHKAKNADMSEYLEATAFECLVGWLYLNGRYERILELIMEEF